MSKILSILISGLSCLTLAIVLYYTIKSKSIFEAFFWHPSSMTISFSFLMSQGILVLCSQTSLIGRLYSVSTRKSKVEVHIAVQVCIYIIIYSTFELKISFISAGSMCNIYSWTDFHRT